MISVNDDGRTHASFSETYPGTPFPEVLFWPYDGGKPRQVLRQAIGIIQSNIVGKMTPCNTYFATLPLGKTFDEIWNEGFWINWHPRSGEQFDAFSATSRPKEITFSNDGLSRGAWAVVASIVHEMAHLNGAPGVDGSGSNAAEQSLLHCGLKAHFRSSAIGMRHYTEIQSRNRFV